MSRSIKSCLVVSFSAVLSGCCELKNVVASVEATDPAHPNGQIHLAPVDTSRAARPGYLDERVEHPSSSDSYLPVATASSTSLRKLGYVVYREKSKAPKKKVKAKHGSETSHWKNERPTHAFPRQSPTSAPAQIPSEASMQVPSDVPTQVLSKDSTQAPMDSLAQVPSEAPTRTPLQARTQVPTLSSEPSLAPSETCLGTTTEPLVAVEEGFRAVDERETNLGQLTADALLDAGQRTAATLGAPPIDLAFTNGGSLQANIPGPKITRPDVERAVPFRYKMVVQYLTAIELVATLEHSLSNSFFGSPENGRFLQIGGGRIRFTLGRPALEGETEVREPSRVMHLEVGSDNGPMVTVVDFFELMVPRDELFVVATTDFIADGGEGYNSFISSRSIARTDLTLQDVLEEYILKLGTVSKADPPEDPRIFLEVLTPRTSSFPTTPSPSPSPRPRTPEPTEVGTPSSSPPTTPRPSSPQPATPQPTEFGTSSSSPPTTPRPSSPQPTTPHPTEFSTA